jgi:DNA polymerase III subunit epsilon
LLDSEILAEVYLELVGGRQPDFGLNPAAQSNTSGNSQSATDWRPRPRTTPLSPRLSAAEAEAHAAFVDKMGEAAIWKKRL